mgnify:CR=1 FL=1
MMVVVFGGSRSERLQREAEIERQREVRRAARQQRRKIPNSNSKLTNQTTNQLDYLAIYPATPVNRLTELDAWVICVME